MTPRARTAIAVVAAGLVAVGLATANAGSATAARAPTVAIAFDTSTDGLPHVVGRDAGDERRLRGVLSVDGGSLTNVRITLSGEGLSVSPAEFTVAEVASGQVFKAVVLGTTGGFHRLTAEVTSDQTGSTTIEGPLYYTSGGEPLPATGDLSGVAYGYVDRYTSLEFDGGANADTLLTFIDDQRAFVGAPPNGRPRCPRTRPDRHFGCVTYLHDAVSGLVQLGDAAGKVIGRSLWISGVGRPSLSEYADEHLLTSRVLYPGPGRRFAGRWGAGQDERDPGPFYDLTLRRNGTYRLLVSDIFEDTTRTSRGTYRFAAPGRMVLRPQRGPRAVHTLAVPVDAAGRARPSQGMWFVYRRDDRSHTPEEILLEPGERFQP